MSQPLYNYLTKQGDYTKSYGDFQAQFADESSIRALHGFMFKNGDYSKSISEFYNQFFAKKEEVKKEEAQQPKQYEYTPVHKDGKEITWEQAKEDTDLYDSLSREEKRTLVKNYKVKQVEALSEGIVDGKIPTQEAKEKPSKTSTLLSSLGVGFVEFGKGFENFKEGVQLGIAELLTPGEMSGVEKRAAIKAIRGTNVFGNSESYDPLIDKLEENIPEYETQSITEDLQKGNYAQAGFRTVSAALRSAPSLVAAATGVGGLVALGVSVAGNKFEEEFEADPEKSTGILLANAGVTGTTEAMFELVTRGLFKRAGFLKGQGNIKAAKELLQGGAKNIVKNIGFGLTAEGASEAATELTVAFEDHIMLGKELNKKDLMHRLGDAAIVGSFIGGGISTVGEVSKTMPKAKDRAEAILMPENIKQEISGKAKELNELIDDLPNVSEEGKGIVNEKINELEGDIINLKKESSSLINNLEGEDLIKYSKNIEDINDIKNVLRNAKTDSEKNIANKKYQTLQEENVSILKEARIKVAEKITKVVKKQAKEIFGEKVTVESMTAEEARNLVTEDTKDIRKGLTEELNKVGKKSVRGKEITEELNYIEEAITGAGENLGFITQFPDGSQAIIVNEDASIKANLPTTAQHEFLHAIIKNTIKGSPESQIALGSALMKEIAGIDLEQIQKSDFADRLRKYEIEGATEAVIGEEIMTVLSESLTNGDIKFNENVFTKIGDVLRRFFQKVGLKKIKFDNGRDVYNFIKDYNASIESGRVDKAIVKVAREGATGKLVEEAKAPEVAAREAARKAAEEDMAKEVKMSKPPAGPDFNSTLNNEVEATTNVKDFSSLSKEKQAEIWGGVSEQERLVIGMQLGPLWRKWIGDRADSNYENNPGWKDNRKEFLDKITVGIQPEDNGLPFIVKTWKPKEAKLTTHIINNLPKRMPHTTRTISGFSEITADVTGAKDVIAPQDAIVTPKVLEQYKTPLLSGLTFVKDQINVLRKTVSRVVGTKLSDIDAAVSKNRSVSPLIADMKAELYVKNGPIHKMVYDIMSEKAEALTQEYLKKTNPKTKKPYTKKDAKNQAFKDSVEAFFKNPKYKKAILESLTTTWLAKWLPMGVQKKVVGVGWKNHDVWKGRKKGTKNGDIEAWQSSEEGPYKGMTDGKQKIRRNPKIMSDVTPAMLGSAFIKGETITDVKRGGLENISLAITQELGIETFKADMVNDGALKKLFVNRQDLFNRLLKDNFVDEFVKQSERGVTKYAKAGVPTNVAKHNGKKASSLLKVLDVKNTTAIMGGLQTIFEDSPGKLTKFSELIPEFVSQVVGINEQTMTEDQKNELLIETVKDKELLQIALEITYGDMLDSKTLKDVGNVITNVLKDVKVQKKARIKTKTNAAVEAILKSTEVAHVKIAKFTNSNMTAVEAQQNKVRQERQRKYDNKLFNQAFKKNKKQAIADLIMRSGHSSTNSKIGDGRGQYYKNTRDYYNKHLKSVKIDPVFKRFTRENKYIYELNVEATAKKNGLKTIPVTKAAQTSASAIKAHAKALLGKKKPLQERRAHEKHARRVLNEHIEFYAKEYKAGNIDNVDMMLMMNSLLSSMNSVLARAARLNLVQLGVKATDTRYEHGQPRVAVLIRLVNEHINKDGVKDIDAFLENYDVNIISKEFDRVITEVGYAETLAEDQTFEDPSYHRMYNDKTRNDKRVKALVEVGTKKVPKFIEAFMKSNEMLLENLDNKNNFTNAVMFSRSTQPAKGITVLDFDDTLATTKSKVNWTAPDGTTGSLNAGEYAAQFEDLLAQGYKFDFTEFDVVIKGKTAPLFNKALKLAKKFGTKDMFILTARPIAAQKAVHEFLKAQGLNIPLKNITALGVSTAEAKALWIAEKVGEGYNDFYFADDAVQNIQAVQNMLDQFDVKSKVQQAKIKFSKDASSEFNNILEQTKGMPASYRISQAKARQRGKKKGNWQFFIPPSADDFAGLLMMFQGKGKQGIADAAWFKKHLLDPFAKADRDLNSARQRTAEEFKALRKKFPETSKKLRKIIPTGDYNYGDAMRVYLWDKAGMEIPGLSNTDKQNMLDLVNGDPDLQAFADVLGEISRKEEGYIAPDEYWTTKDIVADITEDGIIGDGRKEHFAEWKENKDIIFSPENLNKIEFLYGSNFREALEDMLYRMENGSNRPSGQNRIVNNFLNWLNGGISVVMNWNSRSAVLQTLSTVNFINWGDNNVLAAGKAFANQKQFWKDFAYIFNSDMLRQRRAGLKTTIESNELMSEVQGAVNPVRAAIRYLLRIGFTPTKIADSFAIAMGGSTFYRNRIKTYEKQGYTKQEVEEKAWLDFQEIAEETQQSSRPDRISQQQASVLGRLILAFQNTPMQYMRLSKKEILNLVNGRFDGVTGPNSFASKIGKIAYYTAIQNAIFYSMQSALFAMIFSDDEDDEEFFKKKKHRVADGMADSVLRGLGIGGAVVSTIKNMLKVYAVQQEKGWNADESAVLMEGLKLSPPLSIKARQILSADKTMRYNKDVIKEMETFDIDNPMWNAIFNVVEATTNIPMARMESKYKNVRESLSQQHAAWQRIAFFLGWAPWNFNIKNEQIEEVKKEIKNQKTYERKKKQQVEKEEKKAEEQTKIDKQVAKEKELQEKGILVDPKCRFVSTKGNRCKISVANAGDACTIHEEVKQRVDGKKIQCKKIKKDGKKCKMQTSSKSGLCYYHD